MYVIPACDPVLRVAPPKGSAYPKNTTEGCSGYNILNCQISGARNTNETLPKILKISGVNQISLSENIIDTPNPKF